MSDSGACESPAEAGHGVTRFRLFILGGSIEGTRALMNFRQIIERHLSGRCELEVVDVREEGLRALNEGVLITPTLIRITEPIRRIVGDLSETAQVVAALDLSEAEEK